MAKNSPLINLDELKDLLDYKADLYNHPNFIESDPIQIPHLFSAKEDIEISGFFAATIAWGNRKMIINNAKRIMEIMDYEPYQFVIHASLKEIAAIDSFVHRTFNSIDLQTFILALRNIYLHHGGLETIFATNTALTLQSRISSFKRIFFEIEHQSRTTKHISDPEKGSASKRINMFLRWMCRTDNKGVDFGIWKSIPPGELSCPLDVHTGNVARALGLIQRRQNDQKTLLELDTTLRKMDVTDPVKYDFALFGLGVFEGVR